MKKLLFLLAVALVATGQVRAQTFRPGWVLPTQGDTLRGEIEDNGWDEAPTRVRFRPVGGSITAYTSGELRAFRLAGGRYFRLETLPLDRDAQKAIINLTPIVRRNPQPETFLAEVLVDGPVSLLRTAVSSVQHYFVRRANQPVLELSERNYLREAPNGVTTVADGNNYRAELGQYLGDCPAAVQAIGAFQVPALVKVVQTYNRECATPPQAGTEYRPAGRQLIGGYSVGLLGGARYSSYQLQTIKSVAPAPFNNYNLDGVWHPVGGIFADVSTPGRRFALHLALQLTQSGRQDEVTFSSTLVGRLDNRTTLLEPRLGVRYFLASSRQLHFFAGLGLAIPISLRKDVATFAYYDGNQRRQDNSELYYTYTSTSLPYLELGVRQGRFTLAVDGQAERLTNDYSIPTYVAQTGSPIYLFTNSTYSGRGWYVEATLGIALLWKP